MLGFLKKSPLNKMICAFPFYHFEIHFTGKVYHCCPSWLPTIVGNIKQNTLTEIIHGELSTKIRDSIAKGEFSYCQKEVCPYLSQVISLNKASNFGPLQIGTPETLANSFFTQKKISINLSYDPSCNLRCPSCRNETIIHAEDNIPQEVQLVHDALEKNLQELQNQNYSIDLNVTGSGDPFASPLYYKLLKNFEYNPKLNLQLQTNGVLMEERRFTAPMKKMLQFLAVSIDASTPETYALTRRGGNFEKLKQNLDWIDSAIRAKEFPRLDHYKINFIVQKDNYQEMTSFARWILSYPSVNEIWFNLIADWGHLSKQDFSQRAIWQKEHPEHSRFIDAANDPYLRSSPRINIGNLSSFIRS